MPQTLKDCTNQDGGIIVFCQALTNRSYTEAEVISLLVKAAEQGGAVCIRANSVLRDIFMKSGRLQTFTNHWDNKNEIIHRKKLSSLLL